MSKYCTRAKLRLAIGEAQTSHCQRIMALLKMCSMQCDKDAGGLFEKVL